MRSAGRTGGPARAGVHPRATGFVRTNQKFVAIRMRVADDTEPFRIEYIPEEDGEPVKG